MSSADDNRVLCIGLELAWWGGAARDRSSQADCMSSVTLAPSRDKCNVESFKYTREDLSDARDRSGDNFAPNCDADAD